MEVARGDEKQGLEVLGLIVETCVKRNSVGSLCALASWIEKAWELCQWREWH